MTRHARWLHVVLLGAAALGLGAAGWAEVHARLAAAEVPLAISRIFIEFNATDNDLGFHVFLDGEDWKRLKIVNPNGHTIFEVEGRGPYGKRGLTELFVEGAEPSLFEVPREELLAEFPEGEYRFIGKTVDGEDLVGTGTLTHNVPDAPSNVSATVRPNSVVISWTPVTSPPGIQIVGYQVIVGSFQVTVPGTTTSVTVPPEFVASLGSGEHSFEVLAIEVGGNQTITQSSFEVP